LEIRYEQLLSEPEPAIASIYKWLDLEVTPSIVEQALLEARMEKNVDAHGEPGVKAGKWRYALRPEDVAEIESVAGSLLEDLGYKLADSADRSKSRRQPRTLTPLGRRTVTAVRRKLPPVLAAWPDSYRRLQLSNRVLGALLDSRWSDLEQVVSDSLMVTMVSRERSETRRGSAAHALLREILTEGQVFSGRQVRGETFFAVPTVGSLLSLSNPKAGQTRDIAIFQTLRGGVVAELAIYAMPLTD
jgi:hypothetical protein